MSQKRANAKQSFSKKKNETWNRATAFLLAGCGAELYLMLVQSRYIDGKLEQVVGWSELLPKLLYAGIAAGLAGLALALALLKKPGWRRNAGWAVFGAGAFVAASNALILTYNASALKLLCAVVPVVAVLGILWSLYERECAWALTILGADAIVLWVCRKGLGSALWRGKVMAGSAVFLAVLAAAALAAFLADRHGGRLGKLRFLPADADTLPIYGACGLSAVSVIAALVSTAAAYYAFMAVAVVIFLLAAYYTVRQL